MGDSRLSAGGDMIFQPFESTCCYSAPDISYYPSPYTSIHEDRWQRYNRGCLLASRMNVVAVANMAISLIAERLGLIILV